MKLSLVVTIAALLPIGVLAIATPVAATELLSETEISERLRDLPSWTIERDRLVCIYQFANFVEAVDFVDRLVEPAEAAGHHPDIQISYNRVEISLTTHDAVNPVTQNSGGLTDQDFDLAQTISQLSNSDPSGCLPLP